MPARRMKRSDHPEWYDSSESLLGSSFTSMCLGPRIRNRTRQCLLSSARNRSALCSKSDSVWQPTLTVDDDDCPLAPATACPSTRGATSVELEKRGRWAGGPASAVYVWAAVGPLAPAAACPSTRGATSVDREQRGRLAGGPASAVGVWAAGATLGAGASAATADGLGHRADTSPGRHGSATADGLGHRADTSPGRHGTAAKGWTANIGLTTSPGRNGAATADGLGHRADTSTGRHGHQGCDPRGCGPSADCIASRTNLSTRRQLWSAR